MKNRFRIYLDYISALILLVSAVLLIWRVSVSDILLIWKHYVGLVFLAIAIVLFFVRHLYGVLFIGMILFLGLMGLLSFNPAITSLSFGWGSGESAITLLKFQPVFLLWIVIYFIVSGRYFVGIISKKYWEEVRNKER